MPIELEAMVVDPESPAAPLDGEAVRWWVDGTEAGVGLRSSVDPLPAGEHRVTLEYGRRGADPVRIERAIRVEPSHVPPADAWEPVDPFADPGK